MTVFFISHPEVVIDPDIDVRRWRLSERGISRMRGFAATDAAAQITEVWASSETKAIEAAELLAARQGLTVNIDPALGENDRSATGFVPPTQFELLADAFFSRPASSVQGWETAADAQARISEAVERILARPDATANPAIVAHGGVGTLLLCGLLGEPISRARDQPFQGHYWSFEAASREVLHGWKSI